MPDPKSPVLCGTLTRRTPPPPSSGGLFVPGPVPIEPHLLAIADRQLPYNRTGAFSEITREIHRGLQELFQTRGSIALLTASGTGAMEAAATNFLDSSDSVLVVNGGTFGERWRDLCDARAIPRTELAVPPGKDLDLSQLDHLLGTGDFSALLINAHETSTGHLYDIKAIGELTHRHGVLLVVDAISSICADPFSMDEWHVDVAILSTQKALALPPGLSFVAMGEHATERLQHRDPGSLYFDLKNYLTNQERGQSPYTPAIGILLQLHQRLADIREQTLTGLIDEHQRRAAHFRGAIAPLSFEIFPDRPSNAMTALDCGEMDAGDITTRLQTQYQITVAPSGGDLQSTLIRIAHMGAQDPNEVASLIAALTAIDASTTNEKNNL